MIAGERQSRALVFALVAAFALACEALLVRALADESLVPLFFSLRMAICSIAATIFALKRRERVKRQGGRAVSLTILFALFANGAIYAYLLALPLLSASAALAFFLAAPLFTPWISWALTRRRIALGLWLGLVIGLFGAVFILHPEGKFDAWGVCLGLLSAFCGAVAWVISRHLLQMQGRASPLVYAAWLGFLLSIVPLFWFWQGLSWLNWLGFVVAALFGLSFHAFRLEALELTQAGLVKRFLLIAVALALAFNLFLYLDLPHISEFVGIVLIILGVLLVLNLEAK